MKKFFHIIFFLVFSIKSAASADGDNIYIENDPSEQKNENKSCDLYTIDQLRKIFDNRKDKDICDVFIEYGNHATDVTQREKSFLCIWNEYEKCLLDMSPLVQLGLKLIRNFNQREIRSLIAPCVTEDSNSYSNEDINLLFDLSKDEQSDRYTYYIAQSILDFFIKNNYINYYYSNNNLNIVVNKAINMMFDLALKGDDFKFQFSAVKLLLDTTKEFNKEQQKDLRQGLSVAASHLIKKFILFFKDPSQQSSIDESKKIFNVRYDDIGISLSLLECDELYAKISPKLLLLYCKNLKNEYCKYYLANNLLFYMACLKENRRINDDYLIDTGFYFQSAVNIILELARNASNLDCKYEAFKRLQKLTNQIKDVKFRNKLIQEVYEIALGLKDEIPNQFSVDDSLIQEFSADLDRIVNLAKGNWLHLMQLLSIDLNVLIEVA
ncbi:MAG: hypothetical protein Q8L85_07105 [Alphaproteobacteria bacterium]|nr:hypothetical protein [Alphaproteobacteria bacterium]